MSFSQEDIFSIAMDYGSGEQAQKLKEIKEKMKACELCNDKTTAAAFGYLLGLKDKESMEKEDDFSIYDAICSVIEAVDQGYQTAESGVEDTFGLIYLWLKKHERVALDELFSPLVRPGVIKKKTS